MIAGTFHPTEVFLSKQNTVRAVFLLGREGPKEELSRNLKTNGR